MDDRDSDRTAIGWRDVALVVVTAVAAVVILAIGTENAARTGDVRGATLLVAATVPLLWCRRRPLAAFGVGFVVIVVYFGLGYAGGPELPLLLAGLYSVAAAGHRWVAAILTVVIAGGGGLFRVAVEGEGAVTVTIGSALLALVALWGDSVHTRRQLRVETRRRLQLAAAEKETEARARVAQERLRIARELHDVTAHTITTMTVQAGAARDALQHGRPERAEELLTGIRAAGRDATNEMRAVLRVLRSDPPEREPAPGLGQVDELVTTARTAGLDVSVDRHGDFSNVPAAIDLTAYRVVQEALTNVVRHADARRVQVSLRRADAHLDIGVADDGRGLAGTDATPADRDGYGLRGLSERVAAVGGHLQVGSATMGGVEVAARLPIGRAP